MEDSLFWGIPKSAYESADRMLTLARKGGIRQHLIRHGTIEDQSVDEYCNFLQTKLCCEILQLEGADMSAQDETASDGLAAEQEEKTTPTACCREEQKQRNAEWTAE